MLLKNKEEKCTCFLCVINEMWPKCCTFSVIKGIVHFEINFLYVLAYVKGIQDVSVFDSTVF